MEVNKALQALYDRKSVRSYTGEAATEEQIAAILKAVQAAPVAMGRYEQYHVTVVSNKEFIAAADAACAQWMHKPEAHPAYGVPTIVFVSARKPEPAMDRVIDSSCAMIAHNVALAAEALELGACYLYGLNTAVALNEELLAALQLPDGFDLYGAVGIGVTNEELGGRTVAEDRITMNRID